MSTHIELINNNQVVKTTPNDLAVILNCWLNDGDLTNVTNIDTISFLENNPSISQLIYDTTNEYFVNNVKYYSDLITSSGTDRDTINSGLSDFFAGYNSLMDIYPNELIECLRNGYKLNDDECSLFIESCKNPQSQSINFTFFNALKGDLNKTYTREEFELEFMDWLSDWKTNKLLNRVSDRKFSGKYEVFFKYVEEVLLKNENTEILADLKNYVVSGHLYNDLFSPSPKNDCPEIWDLRKVFLEYESGIATPQIDTQFKKLMLERQRNTLCYVRAATGTTNDLSTIEVSIENSEEFTSRNSETRNFGIGYISRMPKGYLDRARFDAETNDIVYIDDVKSSNDYEGRDIDTVKKNFLAAAFLAREKKVKLSIFSPSHCPNISQLSESKVVIGENISDEEIKAINELYLISAISETKNHLDLNSEPIRTNLQINKVNIGSDSNEYTPISQFNIGEKMEKVLSFLEKNIKYNNQTRWEPIFDFYLETLKLVQNSYLPEEISEYKTLFSVDNNNRLKSLLMSCPWYTNLKKRELFKSIDTPAETVTVGNMEWLEGSESSRKYTEIKQEEIKIKSCLNKYELLKDKQTVLTESQIREVKNIVLKFTKKMWRDTYNGNSREKVEETLANYLIRKDIDPTTYLSNFISDKYNGYTSTFINRIHQIQDSWGDIDKISYSFYNNNFNRFEELIVSVAEKITKGEPLQNYKPAQLKFLARTNTKEFKEFAEGIAKYSELICAGREQNIKNLNELKEKTINEITNLSINPSNESVRSEMIYKLENDTIRKFKP